MEKTEEYADVLCKGAVLRIYVQTLKQNLNAVCEAEIIHRIPYFRTKKAKQNLQALIDSLQHCQDAIFLYLAALAKTQLCVKQEQTAYFMIYRFLFDFHDEILKQEWLHLLLIKDDSSMKTVERFITYTEEFVKRQERFIKNCK